MRGLLSGAETQLAKIDVFLLAAGESSRMFPLSQIMEKSLLPVNGRPVIRHIIENLTVPEVAKHIRKITICCLTKFKKQFEHEFRDMPSIEILRYDTPSGTFGTWWQALDDFTSEWSMIHYADCLTEIDYNHFIEEIDPKYDGIIAVTNSVKHDYSLVRFDKENKDIYDFIEKPGINYTWSGIGLFNTHSLEKEYNGYKKLDFAFDIFPQMILTRKLKAYPYNGYWYDVGNLNSYRKVCSMMDGEK